jgi:large subunit ribosomal protein L6
MSRIGKLPIKLPAGVTATVDGSNVTVKGPKGELKRTFHPEIQIKLDNGIITVSRPDDSNQHRSLHGLTRTLINNMVLGVTTGFSKGLEIVGTGYRAEQAGAKINLRIGFSHPVEINPPAGITLALDGAPTKIKVSGIDKEAVGQMADKIRAIKLHDSFKGKGMRYAGETPRLKPGKAGKVVGKK